MKKFLCLALPWFVASVCSAANITVSPWTPIFQGIDNATGRQEATTGSEREQRLNCFRIDLTDPTIELFTTPHCTNCNRETLAQNTTHFLEQYQLQVAINCNFYGSTFGPNDTPLGTPDDVFSLAISKGDQVSPWESGRPAVLMFATNGAPTLWKENFAPNTDGIYTAAAGLPVLLVGGVNQLSNPTENDYDPRTALGISQDKRYLYLMTLDGRQPGWSVGANFYQTAEWLARFGAWDGINVDGGGSTTAVMADCQGKGVRLNRSSFVAAQGRERIIGHNFGVRALPLPSPLKNLRIEPGSTTAIVTWNTDDPGTTQVQYGPTAGLGSSTPLDTRPATTHIATLTGLQPGTNYFFRAITTTATQELGYACGFSTVRSIVTSEIFGMTNRWRYSTNNLDGANWTARTYNDAGWLGPDPALLHLESNAAVEPRNTVLPPGLGSAIVPRTYYFRTHFDLLNSIAGVSLVFSNYIDDGAVFYLNGAEVFRLRMPAAPAAINFLTPANGSPCQNFAAQRGDAAAICPDVFTVSGSLIANNLRQGDNVVAVEVHNLQTGSDLVFGTALLLNRPDTTLPKINLFTAENSVTLFWNGEGFELQESDDLASTNAWRGVGGSATSPVTLSLTNGNARFYRLRR